MGRIRGGKRLGQRVRIGAPDELLTAVTIDLDTTEMEVYGHQKRGMEFNGTH